MLEQVRQDQFLAKVVVKVLLFFFGDHRVVKCWVPETQNRDSDRFAREAFEEGPQLGGVVFFF